MSDWSNEPGVKMSDTRLNRPDFRNLQKGHWHCLGVLPGTPCIWLYRAHSGPLYLGRDINRNEGWFGSDRFADAVALWSRLDGFDYWLSVGEGAAPSVGPGRTPPRAMPNRRPDNQYYVPPPEPYYVPPTTSAPIKPIAEAITDSNPSKRGTDIAKAMSPTESGVRTAVGVAHTVGGVLLTAFGGGAAVAPVGQLHETWLKAAFPT